MREFEVERYWRDAKTFEIGGGSMEVLKNNLGRYLSRLDMSPYLDPSAA